MREIVRGMGLLYSGSVANQKDLEGICKVGIQEGVICGTGGLQKR